MYSLSGDGWAGYDEMTNGETLTDQAGFLVKRPDTRRGTPEQDWAWPVWRGQQGSRAADLFPFLSTLPWTLLLLLLLALLSFSSASAASDGDTGKDWGELVAWLGWLAG